MKSHFSQQNFWAFFGVKLSVICSIIYTAKKTPKFFGKKMENLASQKILTKKIIVSISVKNAKKGHFQNFFQVFISGHF
jgi:hypothetical protein